jgi:hypothetical protein
MADLASGQTVEEQVLPLIGGRRFWIYQAEVPPHESNGDEMFNAAFEALDAEFQSDPSGPVGICVAVPQGEVGSRAEAVWPETQLMHAGMLADGGQIRIRYFYDATIGPGFPNSPSIAESEAQDYSLPPGYRIEPLAQTDAATPTDVLEIWEREQAMPQPEAQRRVHEVLMVALDPDDRVAGVSTVYLQRNPQLGMDLWYYRTFVSSDHRLANLAVRMLWASRDHLTERFAGGEDRRAGGMIMDLENEGLKRYFNRAFWVYSNFYFIGENARGKHVRVHYFPGARVPIPQ